MRAARFVIVGLIILGSNGCASVTAGLMGTTRVSGSSITVRVFNVDDLSKVYLNGVNVLEVGFLREDSRDLTLPCRTGTNRIELTTENTAMGYTWGFEVIVDGKIAFRDEQGTANRIGANHDDKTLGIVYRKVIEFTLI